MADLGPAGLQVLDQQIRELDPDGRFVTLDVENSQVFYCAEITQHERIRDYVGEEEPVRAYLVAWLCVVGGYPPACIELEKRYRFGRSTDMELDLRLTRPDGDVFALVETKAPGDYHDIDDPRLEGQLFAPSGQEPGCRVLSLVTVEIGADETPVVNSVTIDYEQGLTFARWKREGSPHVDDFPINYGEPTHEPFRNGGPHDLRTDVTRPELDRLRRQLHDRLWGGSRDDNQIYAWLVRLFLTKIHDEKVTNNGDPYSVQVLRVGSRREPADVTLARINDRYLDAYRRYITPDARHVEPVNGGVFSPTETTWVVEMLQGLSLTAAGRSSGDLLGGFFESITRDGFKQSKGLFFTHYNLAVFMLEVLELPLLAEEKLKSNAHPNDRLPYIIDPTCGSGTFLLAAMRSVTRHIESRRRSLKNNRDVAEQLDLKFPEQAPDTWAKDFIYGIEKREDLSMSTKVNMVLHRDGHTHVYKDDGLAPLNAIASRHGEEKFRANPDPEHLYDKPVAETFDVVLTNPPFSITLDASVRASLVDTFTLAGDRNSENLFLERWYQLLKPGGRLAAVLPESFFSTTENVAARLFLFARFHVRAIVTLPPSAFQPWTPTRTSLLFAQKKRAAEERQWIESFAKHITTVEAALRSGTTALRKIEKPGRRTTPEQLVAHREVLSTCLTTLGEEELAVQFLDDSALVSARQALQSASLGSLAFARTVEETGSDGDSYVGITVDEIGYRRTRRAENTRPNDLFAATIEIDGEMRPVRNLNDVADGWQIVLGEGPPDALTILREARLWR